MATGLPIKIVVLTIVGMVGLGAMLMLINNSENIMPRPMHADIYGNELVILPTSPDVIEWKIEVLASGAPVEKASVVLSGLEAAAINRTDTKGETLISLNKTDLVLDASEGYLKLEVKAPGFQDYSNDNAIKIVK
ncbi:MAG: hypothetical protein J5U19_02870 [Candidatus Methanoperedens sp.]|nr:hypothetical protein [Candidatus Methanoperedens sp.]